MSHPCKKIPHEAGEKTGKETGKPTGKETFENKEFVSDFQTRSQDGSIDYYPSLALAVDAYKHDPTIWKISWFDKNEYTKKWYQGHFRWRPKRNNPKDRWSPLSETKLQLLSSEYKKASPKTVFWVRQAIMVPDGFYALKSELALDVYDEISDLVCIIDILNEADFLARFKHLVKPSVKYSVKPSVKPLVKPIDEIVAETDVNPDLYNDVKSDGNSEMQPEVVMSAIFNSKVASSDVAVKKKRTKANKKSNHADPFPKLF